MKYEEIVLQEALELSDTKLETIVGAGQHRGWSEGDNDHDGGWWSRCRCRNGGQSFGDQSYDGDDWQRRCRRRR